MKIQKLSLSLALAFGATLGALSTSSWAEEAPVAVVAEAATPAAATPAVAEVAAPTDAAALAPAAETPAVAAVAEETKPAEPVAEAAPAPQPKEGNVTWMMISTALVLFMSLPGLALFYGGMARKKNMLSTLTQVFAIFCVISVLWVVYGYSLAFSDGNAFIGGFSKVMLKGVVWTDSTNSAFVNTGTFSKGVVIPELIFAMFQLTFAAITISLIAGGFAERMKFKAVMLFSVLFFTFAYLPMAHMVWWWAGPDAYTATADVGKLNASAGWLWQKGALDFAGGTVVHINAGIAGLVAAIIVGKRAGYGKVSMPPHSLTMTTIGAAMLWFGWFGFNAGSNLEANGYAVLAFANTLFATAVAAITWFFAEWVIKGKPSLLGIISGAVAGLVAITPACGFVGIQGAMVIGMAAGLVCFVAVSYLKRALGYDDALDAFGVHAVGGIIGAVLTGVFVDPALGGAGFATDWVGPSFCTAGGETACNIGGQVITQITAVGVAILWSAVVATVALLICKFTVGLRVTPDEEAEGLDIAEHGEQAYHD